ncbi:MAG: SDR family NAD(P)-dependent oxidoreductase [Rhodospirillaceae bacterium]|nr:SDR family NAD(P)-dependent oxidoreductase [Rhodospirillaceae bacterium]MDE0618239.1 SDR family NAD(P)-dependent oxidoreductase [Rhodospirillaceae bacterium]
MASSESDRNLGVVIGGARGIGLAAGRCLLRDGWRVVVADLDSPEASEPGNPDKPDNAGNGLHYIQTDVADSASMDRLAAEVEKMGGGSVHGLVNAAGYNRHGAVSEIDDRTWQGLLDVHLGGVIRACRAFYPSLRRARGAVVNFSSIGARIGRPRRAPYGAAKAGIEALTRTLAIEWAADGVRVNAVAPGIVDTRMIRQNIERGLVDPERLRRSIPLGRFAEPAEVAEAVAFLLSGRAGYITGQTLAVDGGLLANGDR